MAEIDRYLVALQEMDGSDLHLSPTLPPRVRVHGSIQSLPSDPLVPEDTLRLLREIMPPENQREFKETHDTDFAYELAGVARFRVNVFRNLYGVGGVLRSISTQIPTVEDLGLPESVQRFCRLASGLVLVTGPTGSGKSTTLAAMVDKINREREGHIITVEDPIEYVHQSRQCLVNQREIRAHTESFGRALRAALREDPDILLVGEMRDLETTRIAIEMAETGHLVFATLHTRTAPSTVDRLIGQFPADEQDQIRSMVASSLKGVVSQSLLRRKEGGRVAAFEVLVVNPAIRNTIRENKLHQIPSMMQIGGKQGMICLNDSLLRLAVQELVTPQEALAKAEDADDLKAKLRVAGVGGARRGTEPQPRTPQPRTPQPRTPQRPDLRSRLRGRR